MKILDDYTKVKELADLFAYLDWLSVKYNETEAKIKALGATMSASDIRYAIKESEKK